MAARHGRWLTAGDINLAVVTSLAGPIVTVLVLAAEIGACLGFALAMEARGPRSVAEAGSRSSRLDDAGRKRTSAEAREGALER